MVDLDLTILHAVRVHKDFDAQHFLEENHVDSLLEVDCDEESKYVIKFRPYLREFLLTVQDHFQLFVYTKGTRQYALDVLRHLQRKYRVAFQQVITRDDTAQLHKKSLHRLFAKDVADNMVLILDDNLNIWNHFKDKVVLTKPFNYFAETGDLMTHLAIQNHDDHFILVIAKKLVQISQAFWRLIAQAQHNPHFFVESTNVNNLSKKKWKQTLKDQQSLQLSLANQTASLHSVYWLMRHRNISLSAVYHDFKLNILTGTKLYFALTAAHPKDIHRFVD